MTVFIDYNGTEYTVYGRYIPVMKALITGSADTSVPEDGGYWCDENIDPEPEGEEETKEIMERATEEAEMIIRGWK